MEYMLIVYQVHALSQQVRNILSFENAGILSKPGINQMLSNELDAFQQQARSAFVKSTTL
jgi:hypothetical protein